MVMYDRQNESWWQQFTGTGTVGTNTGIKFRSIPARLESFSNFMKRHPGGRVLILNDETMRAYGRSPYACYDTATAPFLFDRAMPDGIEPMASVVIVKMDRAPQAITIELLRKESEVQLGDMTLKWQSGQNSALDPQQIAKGRDIGNAVAIRTESGNTVEVVYDVTFAFVFHAFFPEIPIRKS